jgi:hypothetical protein
METLLSLELSVNLSQSTRHHLTEGSTPRLVCVAALEAKLDRAIAQAVGQVIWDLWWTEWHGGRFYPSTLVSPANSHYTDSSTLIIYHLGLVQ